MRKAIFLGHRVRCLWKLRLKPSLGAASARRVFGILRTTTLDTGKKRENIVLLILQKDQAVDTLYSSFMFYFQIEWG